MAEPFTDIYRFFYLTEGVNTGSVVHEEFKRWQAVETQMFELYSLFGNGILTGWEIQGTSAGNVIAITPGSGHIGYKSTMTIDNTFVTLEVPPGLTVPSTGIKYIIYGIETNNTNVDRSVNFFASTNILNYNDYNTTVRDAQDFEISPGGLIIVGEIVMKPVIDNSGTIISYVLDDATYELRDEIGLFDNLSKFIKDHIHIGGANNPSKIDLMRNVTGKLSADHIFGDLSADLITKGTLSPDRQAKFSHSELVGSGILSHAQIEAIILALDLKTDHYLGDVAIANLVKIVLMLKHVFIQIDETLLNLIAFIPGITTDDWIDDSEFMTAVIDTVGHRILGILATPSGSDFITWNTKQDFEEARDAFNLSINDFPDTDNNSLDTVTRSSNITVQDDGTVTLDKNPSVNEVQRASDTEQWISAVQVINNDSFGQGKNFGVVANVGYFVFKLFKLPGSNSYKSQDWRGSTKLEFAFKLEGEENINHGDIRFFLVDAVPPDFDEDAVEVVELSGSSNTKIIVPTGALILADGLLTDGWQFIQIDLTQFSDLSHVAGVGFYSTTATGWAVGEAFEFDIQQPEYSKMKTVVSDILKDTDPEKDVIMYRYNDLTYSATGFIKFRFSPNQAAIWDFIDYDSTIPNYTGIVLPKIDVSTKAANTEADLLLSSSHDIITYLPDPTIFTVNENKTQWIEITVTLSASDDRTVSPILESLILYYTASVESNQRSWSTLEEWQDYINISNITLTDDPSGPDSISLSDYSNTNLKYYVEGNSIKVLDDDNQEIAEQEENGTSLPKSPIQAFFKEASGLLHPSFIEKNEDGTWLIADTGNDRIVELYGTGDPYRIIQGNSYLGLKNRDLVALTASYNTRLAQIAICFSQNLQLSALNLGKISIVSIDGTNEMPLGDESKTSARMIGSSLIQNIKDLDSTEFKNINNSNNFTTGAETQSGFTIIPGLGKTGDKTTISNEVGAILIFDLTSQAKAEIDSWSSSKKIVIYPDFWKPVTLTTGGSATGGTAGSLPAAQWFDESSVTGGVGFKGTSTDQPSSAFTNNYNPFIFADSATNIVADYDTPVFDSESVSLDSTTNLYSLLPHKQYINGTTTSYLAEPRYNLPQLLIRVNSFYEYPVYTNGDINKLYQEIIPSDADWKKLGDFDDDGNITQEVMMDIDGNDHQLEVIIDELDIIYWDILHPVSVEKQGDTEYVIAQANKHSVVDITTDGNIAWSIFDTIVNFNFGDFGSARMLSNGNVFVAAPRMNLLGEIIIDTQNMIDSIQTQYGPVDAYKLDNGNILILVAQRHSLALNSRAYILDNTNDIIWEWGLGRLSWPTGLTQIEGLDSRIISC